MNNIEMSETTDVINILKEQSIRWMDGRYREGFVDTDILATLIENGIAEIYGIGGVCYVRLKDNPQTA